MASVVDERGKAGIEKQIVLPWSRALQMTRENIFVRLGRSAITASGIFLGIAFLSAVLFGAAAAAVAAKRQAAQFGIDTAEAETQARVIWLAAMSLLVATVGIVNSMLMSVTERYKEIGTMKCLGALDSFIVRLFLLEAGLLGILGSASGAIAGTGVMTVVYANKTLVSVGKLGWSGALSSWTETCLQLGSHAVPLWLGIVFAVLVGGLLSLLAATYPAWRAAKMPPAAALRSEF